MLCGAGVGLVFYEEYMQLNEFTWGMYVNTSALCA